MLENLVHKCTVEICVFEWQGPTVKHCVVSVREVPARCLSNTRFFDVDTTDSIESTGQQLFVVTTISAAEVKPVS